MIAIVKRLALILVPIAALALAYFGFFFYRDNFATHYPLKVISAQSYRAFEIPWWNLHDGGGQPLAGNPNALTFYPDNVLYLFLPAHVAFNLHFLLHLAIGWMAMRALTRSSFAATVYLLSGVVISATSFYNLIVYAAMIPFALVAVERRSWRWLGCAFGLMLLAAEPMMLFAAVLCVAITGFRRLSVREFATAVALAAMIGAPQILAYLDIATEVERSAGISARTVLNTSLTPLRVSEIIAGPLLGFEMRMTLFATLFIGVIALCALFQKSRYTAVALTMLFFALGRFNPVVAFAVEQFDAIRIMRFPEKFALPMTVALCVLIATFFAKSRYKIAWAVVTLVPLAYTTFRTLPVDLFAPYDVAPVTARRVFRANSDAMGPTAREEYRRRAKNLEPLFGSVAGLRYVVNRSPDRMHSLLSRIAEERTRAGQKRYVQLALGAPAFFLPRVEASADVNQAVALFEQNRDVAPFAYTSAPAKVNRYREKGQRLEILVETRGPAVLLVNQSYFSAWRASMDDEPLETFPVNVDRLGVLVPRSGTVDLAFGKRRLGVAVAWLASLLLLGVALVPQRVEELDRGAGEVERAADEDRSLA